MHASLFLVWVKYIDLVTLDLEFAGACAIFGTQYRSLSYSTHTHTHTRSFL